MYVLIDLLFIFFLHGWNSSCLLFEILPLFLEDIFFSLIVSLSCARFDVVFLIKPFKVEDLWLFIPTTEFGGATGRFSRIFPLFTFVHLNLVLKSGIRLHCESIILFIFLLTKKRVSGELFIDIEVDIQIVLRCLVSATVGLVFAGGSLQLRIFGLYSLRVALFPAAKHIK